MPNIPKALLGGILGILLGNNQEITCQTSNHDEDGSHNEPWKESCVEGEAPNHMHLRDIISSECKISLHAFGVGVAPTNISKTVVLHDQEENHIHDDVSDETPRGDASYYRISGSLHCIFQIVHYYVINPI
jgi:hypothetical protein